MRSNCVTTGPKLGFKLKPRRRRRRIKSRPRASRKRAILRAIQVDAIGVINVGHFSLGAARDTAPAAILKKLTGAWAAARKSGRLLLEGAPDVRPASNTCATLWREKIARDPNSNGRIAREPPRSARHLATAALQSIQPINYRPNCYLLLLLSGAARGRRLMGPVTPSVL